MSPFNRPDRTPIIQTHPNYSSMGDKLNYCGSASLHTQDFMEFTELLRESVVGGGGGGVPGSSNPQTPRMNQQRGVGSRVMVARECGTRGRLGHPG